jgi:hypothetical protein
VIRYSVQGLKEIESVLNKLPVKVQQNIVGPALRAAVKPMYDEAKQNAPRGQNPAGRERKLKNGEHVNYGTIFSNMRITVTRKASVWGMTAIVHTRDAFWALFQELPNKKPGSGKHPFLSTAFEHHKVEALGRFRAFVFARMSQAVQQLAGNFKRGGK